MSTSNIVFFFHFSNYLTQIPVSKNIITWRYLSKHSSNVIHLSLNEFALLNNSVIIN